MRRILLKILPVFFVTFVLWIFLVPQAVLAQEKIKNFDVVLIAHQNGDLSIEENISYDFGESFRHGIYRTIPLVSKVGNLYRVISINFTGIKRDGLNDKYQVDLSAEETKVKIGDPDRTITGDHSYTIKYDVKNGIGSNFTDHDEIYWNVTGNEWSVSIEQSSVLIKTDFGVLPKETICFTGVAGSKKSVCRVEEIEGGKKIIATSPLSFNEGLTIVSSFPVNTFPKSILQKDKPWDPDFITFLKILIPIYFFLNLILAPGLVYWYLKNKKKSRFGLPSVNFDIPEDNQKRRVTPAEAGSIDIYRVDQNDVIATIFDLAIRKYIKIEQIKKEKVLSVFGDGEDYLITKLKNINEDTEDFEQTLLQKLFDIGDSINLSTLKQDFYETFTDFEQNVFKSLIKRSFYIKNPKDQMTILFVLGIILTFVGGLILGPIIIFLSRKLNGRTALGDEMDWRIDGLKIFLKNMRRYYAWQAKNLYTVEKYIPYAIAFGFIKEFMVELKIIYPNYSPSWYSGNLSFYMATNSMFNSMNSTFTTHAPSSSSGFSGGGSSGGGGGGGGGGSW